MYKEKLSSVSGRCQNKFGFIEKEKKNNNNIQEIVDFFISAIE